LTRAITQLIVTGPLTVTKEYGGRCRRRLPSLDLLGLASILRARNRRAQ
jgi:hypothetical protein